VPGLFLAVAAAFAVLAVNRHWLLPSLDDTGVRYLTAAPQLAAGATPAVPIAPWDATSATTGLEGVGTLMPILMAVTSAGGTRVHVAALWVLCGAAAVAVLALAWTAGGAAGVPAALLAGALVAAAPCTLDAVTAVDPSILLASLVALMVGVMVYRPRWNPAHGLLAALAWLSHPAGAGAVAAATVWPVASGERRARKGTAALLAAAPAALLLALGARWPLLSPPGAPGAGPAFHALLAAIQGLLSASAPFAGGAGWLPAGAALLAALGALVVTEARATPTPPPMPHWTDPAAADLLALRLRRASAVTALAALIGTAWGGRVGGGWLPAALLLLALGVVAAARWARRIRGPVGWGPVALLLLWGGAAAWTTRTRALDLRTDGRGLTARVWVASPVVRWLDNRARPYGEIYASEPALVLVQSGRGARALPRGEGDDAAFAARFAAHPGAVVLTGPDATDRRAAELSRLLGVRVVVRSGEGRVLVPADAGG